MLFKVFETVKSVIDSTKEQPKDQTQSTERQAPAPGFGDQVEMRLTNIVVAALKEAFNRDDARLDLERANLEEQRRRAEELRRTELRRQAVDRETGRLRLLAAAGLIGWVAAVILLFIRDDASDAARALVIAASVLSLCSTAAAFVAQARIARQAMEDDSPLETHGGALSLWAVFLGLALASFSLLL
jgi:hypothetical protein